MLSRSLQVLWLTLVLLIAGGVAWLSAFPVMMGLWTCLALALGFLGLLALQFVALYVRGRLGQTASSGSVSAPTAGQVLRAWWGESLGAFLAFAWWMPWRAQAQPDFLPTRPTGERGVVLIHGYVCNRGLWMRWFPRLRERGHAYVAINLEPVLGSIDAYVPLIDAAVQRMTRATGRPPVLICHSMGGLAARAWLRAEATSGQPSVRRVERVITLGTPHAGTSLASLNPFHFSLNALQMRLNSAWLQSLRHEESALLTPSRVGGAYSRFTCYYGHCDNIVFPLLTATLPGADNRHLPAMAHVAMALDLRVIEDCLALVRA